MATEKPKDERKVSLTISIRVGSLTATEAQALEDAIRGVADDYEADVSAMRGQERPGLVPR